MFKKICVIGLGYIGLPTASMFATHGVQVVGVDVNPHVVEVLNKGNIHIEETGLQEAVHNAIALGNLVVKSKPEAADAFIIAVPTPHHPNKTADMRAVTAASESIVPYLRKGNLVILESTSPPLATVNLLQPILERSGLKAGTDFFLAYSPERVLPGQILKELIENERVIGGINQASAEAGRALYQTFVKGNISLTNATTAEMVKLMENTYRDINIAIANEFAMLSERMGINVWEAISIANRHPRVKILSPGPGVGGHCIAVDPWFLVEAAPDIAALIQQARVRNDGMPTHVVETTRKLLDGDKEPVIACLGLTFKPDVDDVRESPAIEVVERLAQAGFQLRAYDPHVKALNNQHGSASYNLCDTLEEAVNGADLLLLLVSHAEFRAIAPVDVKGMRARRVYDTRNFLDADAWRREGFTFSSLGNGSLV